MSLTRETKFGLWVLAAVVLAGTSYFVGGLMRPDAEPHYTFDTSAPAFGAPSPLAATSPGGFTGFGETDGSNSQVVVSGRVTELTASSLTLEGPQGQRSVLTFGDAPAISRLVPSELGEIEAGMTVSVRLNPAGDQIEALLVVAQP